MRILLVEDEGPKRGNILSALEEISPGSDVSQANSVSSAIRYLRKDKPELIVLDMSLPTFDVSPDESGGRPQGFGGIEVLRYIDRFRLRVPVIVITAYEAFPKDGRQIKLDVLSDQLRASHPNTFYGIAFYDSAVGQWRDELRELMAGAVRK